MNNKLYKTKKRKSSIKKKIIVFLSIPLILYILMYTGAIFYLASQDPSSKDPVYSGPIINDDYQYPIENKFNHYTTAMEVARGMTLKGKIIVMTGGHSGTGLEAAKAFINAGATIIALTPDVAWAKRQLKGLSNVEIEYVDLLRPASIDAFAQKFLKTKRPIYALINSAGLYNIPLMRDSRGYEDQLAVNVLGHFELTLKLLPALKKSNGARIINLSSRGHRLNDAMLNDINFEHTPYTGMQSYARTKTALSLLSVKEDELFKQYNIRAFAVHPGPIPTSNLFATSLSKYAPAYKVWMMEFMTSSLRAFWGTEILNYVRNPKNIGDIYKTVEQGGATTAWAATSADLNNKGGLYLEDCNIAQMVPNGSKAPFGVRPWALNKKSADKLWNICEEMTGMYYNND